LRCEKCLQARRSVEQFSLCSNLEEVLDELDVIVIAVCATICGAEGFIDMEEFGHSRKEWLRTFLELPHGIPSHDTIGRVFAALEPTAFAACLGRWVKNVTDKLARYCQLKDASVQQFCTCCILR